MIVYDSTDNSNWNVVDYQAGLAALSTAQQILLTASWSPTTQPQTISPANPGVASVCRCFGTWNDISTISLDGVAMTLTLVAVDDTDPTIIYDLSATPLKNRETGLLLSQRVVNLTIVAGQLQNVNEDSFVDLTRTDFIDGKPEGTTLQYLLTCEALGAPGSLSLLSSETPVSFQPILFKLETTTIQLTQGGTFDLSKKAVA